MSTDAAGNVLLDHLPTPVIGTFWPYSGDKSAKLVGVTAARRRVLIEQTALTLRDLLETNVGAEVLVNEGTAPYPATIIGFPTRTSEELAATMPPLSPEPLPQKGNLILLKTAEGTKVVNADRIQDVKFLSKYKTALANEEFRNLLTLKLDWTGGKPEKAADVGIMYLQKGVRWIPNYPVTGEEGTKYFPGLEILHCKRFKNRPGNKELYASLSWEDVGWSFGQEEGWKFVSCCVCEKNWQAVTGEAPTQFFGR
jgi:hypothetical protein